MSTIKVVCIDQTLAFNNTPVITSGGLNEDFVSFTFCALWSGFTRTAVFWRNEKEVYHQTLDADDRCQIPPEVTGEDGVIYFGVFGVNAKGVQRTSEVLNYRIHKGAITTGTKPSNPTPDIYTQILASCQDVKDEVAVERARINNLIKLEEGSTTGDAELTDIRVGADGTVHPSAGEAVRYQYLDAIAQTAYLEGSVIVAKEELHDIRKGYDGKVYDFAGDAVRGQIAPLAGQIQPLTDAMFGKTTQMIFDTDTDMDKLEVGMINNAGNVYTNSGGDTRTHTPMVDISGEPVTVRVNAYNSNGMCADISEHPLWIAQYDADKNFITGTRKQFALYPIAEDGTVATTGAYYSLLYIQNKTSGFINGGQAVITPADGAAYAILFGFPVGCSLDMEIWAGEEVTSDTGLSGEVKALRGEVDALSASTENLATEIEGLKERMDEDGEQTELEADVSKLNEAVFGEVVETSLIFNTDTDMDKVITGMINAAGGVDARPVAGGDRRFHVPMFDISGEPVTVRVNAYNSNGVATDYTTHEVWIAQYDADKNFITGTRTHFNLYPIGADGTVATTGAYPDLLTIEKAQNGNTAVKQWIGGGQATITPAEGAAYAIIWGFFNGVSLDMEIWAGEYDVPEGSGLIHDVEKLAARVSMLEENQDDAPDDPAVDVNADANAPLIATVFGNTPGYTTDFSAVVITDLHGKFISLDEANALRNTYAPNSPIFNAGDMINLKAKQDGVMNSEVAAYMEKAVAYGVYHTIGQHEVGFRKEETDRLKTNCMSHEEVFNTFIAPMKSVWGLPNLTTNYYYKDFGNTRLISLYQYEIPLVDDPNNSNCYKYPRMTVWMGQNQIDWLISTLNSVPDGYKVIIMMHQGEQFVGDAKDDSAFFASQASPGNTIINGTPVVDIVQAYIDKTSISKNYVCKDTATYPTSDFSISVNADFSDAKGSFAHYLSGDAHIDCVGHVVGTKQRHIVLTSCNQSYDCIVLPAATDERRRIVNLLGYCYSKGYVKLGRVGQQYAVTGQTRIFEKVTLTE